MTVDYSTLTAGQEVSNTTIVLDSNTITRYIESVSGDSTLRYPLGPDVVPPMAIAALGLRAIINDLGIPEGTLHSSQDLAFLGPTFVGDKLTCRASVKLNSVRRESRFVSISLCINDAGDREVMTGTTTLIMPATGTLQDA